jgi:acylphosphatase
LSDGTVEVLVGGPEPALAELEGELARGPSAARVERVEKTELPREVTLPNHFEAE